jgi:hypothetical protein
MVEAGADGDGVEAGVLVEEDVRPPAGALSERHTEVHELLGLGHLEAVELRPPRIDVLGMKWEHRLDSIVEGSSQARDDAAVEEDAVRKRVDEDEPDQQAKASRP